MTWWLLKLDHNEWFVLDGQAIDPAQVSNLEHQIQHKQIRISIADTGAILSVSGTGSEIKALRRDLDSVEEDRAIFWSPPESLHLTYVSTREELGLPETIS
jgi:hypothetical protein